MREESRFRISGKTNGGRATPLILDGWRCILFHFVDRVCCTPVVARSKLDEHTDRLSESLLINGRKCLRSFCVLLRRLIFHSMQVSRKFSCLTEGRTGAVKIVVKDRQGIWKFRPGYFFLVIQSDSDR